VLFSRFMCSPRVVKTDATTAKLDGLEPGIVGLTGAIFLNGLAEMIKRAAGSFLPPGSALQVFRDYQRTSNGCNMTSIA